MTRARVHSVDTVLDTARDIAVERGPRSVTVRAVAEGSGAPTGTLYHAFGSRDELVAQAWLRAVTRFQSGWLDRLHGGGSAIEDATAAATYVASFAIDSPLDAMLLADHSLATLLDGDVSASTRESLAHANDAVRRAITAQARRLYGGSGRAAVERCANALIDLPHAVVRRHLRSGTLDASVVTSLERLVPALLAAPGVPASAVRRG